MSGKRKTVSGKSKKNMREKDKTSGRRRNLSGQQGIFLVKVVKGKMLLGKGEMFGERETYFQEKEHVSGKRTNISGKTNIFLGNCVVSFKVILLSTLLENSHFLSWGKEFVVLALSVSMRPR